MLLIFFPILEKLDPHGLKRATSRGVRELYSVWKAFVNERREILRRGERTNTDEAEDFLDVFLENGLDDDQIDWLGLVRNRLINTSHPISKAQKSKLGKPLNESDIYNLPYLTSIVKETLRLHPPAPLLVPHRSLETLQVMNYTIPDGARLEVNAWAIGRDVSIWGEDAASFRPKRFVGSSVDFRGQDFQLLPFSAGRRMCPGTSLAARQIPLLLANLVWNFNWSLPDGEESATELDMEEKFMLILQKERPLVLVPRRRSLILQVSLEIA
ncbi:(S)-N-methylcoclaurine 3'-hydroxylase isozyme 1 (Fragment) [Linum perenne]